MGGVQLLAGRMFMTLVIYSRCATSPAHMVFSTRDILPYLHYKLMWGSTCLNEALEAIATRWQQ
jgi:hypothetical protein